MGEALKVKTSTEPTQGGGGICRAKTCRGRCTNQARWQIHPDDGSRTVPVCLSHADKAYRRGELEVIRVP